MNILLQMLLTLATLAVIPCYGGDFFRAYGVRVVDGDTLAAERLDVGYGVALVNVRSRALKYDAWEVTGDEKPKGDKATAALKALVAQGVVYIVPDKQERDRDNFGRLLGRFIIRKPDGTAIIVDEYMRANGHTKPASP